MTKEDEETGEEVGGIFIPFRANDLLVTKRKNVIAVFNASVAQLPSGRYTHVLTQVLDASVAEERKAAGYDYNKIVGHMRPKNYKKHKYQKKKKQ